MINDLRGRAAKQQPLTTEMMRGLKEAIATLYTRNLSGAVPSTDWRPLPVGVRTGTLRAGVKAQMLNQYSFKVTNDVPYSGFIEVGTRYMAPRRPLGAAVDQIAGRVPSEMNKVLTEVWG